MSEQPWKDTNSLVLNQIGTPPPAGVLATVVALTGAVPEALSTVVAWGDEDTNWAVVGVTDRHLFRVTGHKNVKEWRGGRAIDDGVDETIVGEVHPLSGLTSLHYDLDRCYRQMSSWADTRTTGTWTARFEGGAEVAISDTDPSMGNLAIDAVAEIAGQLRESLS